MNRKIILGVLGAAALTAVGSVVGISLDAAALDGVTPATKLEVQTAATEDRVPLAEARVAATVEVEAACRAAEAKRQAVAGARDADVALGELAETDKACAAARAAEVDALRAEAAPRVRLKAALEKLETERRK